MIDVDFFEFNYNIIEGDKKMTNLAYKPEEWYLEEWDYLVDELTNVFRLTKKRT